MKKVGFEKHRCCDAIMTRRIPQAPMLTCYISGLRTLRAYWHSSTTTCSVGDRSRLHLHYSKAPTARDKARWQESNPGMRSCLLYRRRPRTNMRRPASTHPPLQQGTKMVSPASPQSNLPKMCTFSSNNKQVACRVMHRFRRTTKCHTIISPIRPTSNNNRWRNKEGNILFHRRERCRNTSNTTNRYLGLDNTNNRRACENDDGQPLHMAVAKRGVRYQRSFVLAFAAREQLSTV